MDWGERPVALCVPQSEFGAAQNLEMSTRCGLKLPLVLVDGAGNTQKVGGDALFLFFFFFPLFSILSHPTPRQSCDTHNGSSESSSSAGPQETFRLCLEDLFAQENGGTSSPCFPSSCSHHLAFHAGPFIGGLQHSRKQTTSFLSRGWKGGATEWAIPKRGEPREVAP